MTENPEFLRILRLVSALSEARCRRIAKASNPLRAALAEEKYPPEGDEEKAIWLELTAPHNYTALRSYVESHDSAEINRYALRLHEALLTDATHRLARGD
jgi:hypothetical protein